MKKLAKWKSASPLLVFGLLFLGLASASDTSSSCASVAMIKANQVGCSGKTIRLKAYLVSTRHGSYFADAPDDQEVLGVSFSESEVHRNSVEAVLNKLTRANIGKPYAELYGNYEGRLIVSAAGKQAIFEIFAEVAEH